MRFAISGSSVIGPAHLQDNLPNQDAVMFRGIQQGYCAVICDGLGSRKKSHLGAKKAAQILRKLLRADSQVLAATPLQISQKLQKHWLSEFNNNPQPYETTCLWAHINPDGYGKAAQVGDGLLLIKAKGIFQIITPLRDGFGNQTQTLAQANIADWVTMEFQLSQLGDGVLLMTDGISDDLIPEQLEDFFDVVYQQLKKTNKRRCKRWLTKELTDWSTPKHGDDKSIAGIFRVK